jgi:hypothetical protein
MRQKAFSTFLAATLFSGTIAYGAAAAAFTKHHVTGCGGTFINVGEYAFNSHPEFDAAVFCTVPDTEERQAHQIAGVEVAVYDGHSSKQVSLSLCYVAPEDLSIRCRSEAVSGPPSDVKHTLLTARPPSFWAESPGGFKMLRVMLPPDDGDRTSRLHGFSTF